MSATTKASMEREVLRLEQLVERRRERVADAEHKLAMARKRLKPVAPVKSARPKRKRAASGGSDA